MIMAEAQNLIPYTKERSNTVVSTTVYRGGTMLQRIKFDDYRKILGSKLVNHESLISAGRSATTPLTGQFRRLVEWNLPTLYYKNYGVDCRQNYWGLLHTLAIPSDSSLTSQSEAGAIAQLNGKINYYQRPFSAQIFTGEIRETLAFLRHPLERSLALASSTKQVLLKLAAGRPLSQVLRGSDRLRLDFSKSWLEFRFAVIPLLSDISTILEVLERDYFENHKLTSMYYSGGSSTEVFLNQPWFHGFSNIKRTIVKTSRTTIKCGFLRELQSNVHGLTEMLSENITDFSEVAVTAWELTTLSWLIDYFVNVQQVLEGFSYKYTSLLSWSSVSTKLTYRYTDVVTSWTPGNGTTSVRLAGNSPPSWTFENTALTRSVLSSTVPPLVITIPGSGIKLANIAALVSTKLHF